MGLTRIVLVWTTDLPAVEVSREGWVPHIAFWELSAGYLKMWRTEDWAAVRVEHPSGVKAEIGLPVWFGVHSHRVGSFHDRHRGHHPNDGDVCRCRGDCPVAGRRCGPTIHRLTALARRVATLRT